MLGTAGEMLVYPWASSPIFYIGLATSLRRRLLEHQKYTLGARDNYWDKWWWPRYQYGAAFGAACTWFTSDSMSPAELEGHIVSQFYKRFGSIPVANTRWPRVPDLGTDEE